jgi:hypothetical protein
VEEKLEPAEVLKVYVKVAGSWGDQESFLARMLKDGRIVVPKLILVLLKEDESRLVGEIMEVTLEPA